MAYVEFMNVTFNPADYAGADEAAKQAAVHAEAAKLFGYFAQTPNTTAHPEVVFDGADSHVKAVINAAPVAVSGGYSTKAAMDADLAPAAGTLVNCYDPDGTKRGRYSKSGASGTGSWSYVAPIADYLWPDPNHENRLLNLIPFGSWINSTPNFPLRGPQAIYPTPPGNDWRNVRLTFTVRAQSLKMGPWTKIALHCQGDIPARTAVLPQVHASGNYFFPNYFNKAQLISDQLGFAQPGSWGTPNTVPSVEDSGWVDVVVDFSVKDRDWENLGRIDRALSASPYHYGAAPVEELLQSLTGNIYWLAVYEKPQSDSTYWSAVSSGISAAERLTGTLMLKRIKAEYLT